MSNKRKRVTFEYDESESSNDEFDMDLFDEGDYYTYNADYIDSDSDEDKAHRKKRTTEMDVSNESETEETENNVPNEDTVLQDVIYETIDLPKINFSPGSKNSGPNIPATCCQPIDFFQLFFTEQLLEDIVKQTNQYAKTLSRKKEWAKKSIWKTFVDVTVTEIKAFIGIILNMGLIKVPEIKDYWAQSYHTRIPFFSGIFRRERFLQIYWTLHLNTNASNKTVRTKTQKISNFLDYIDERFRANFVPNKEILIDESVIQCRGRVSFITFNPTKQTKWGIRVYVLADSNSGYIYSFLPYYGNNTMKSLVHPDLPLPARIVLHLYQKLLDSNPNAQGHHIYLDSFYTSMKLARELLQQKCYVTGTIQRRFIPSIVKKPLIESMSVYDYRFGETLLLSWKNRMIITTLGTYNTAEMITINIKSQRGDIITEEKPKFIVEYNKYMQGVDKADKYCRSYPFLRKSQKWWKKLFYWGLEVSSVNSYILYKHMSKKKDKKPMSYIRYTRALIDQMVGNFRDGQTSRNKPSSSDKEERLNGKLHIIRRNPKSRSKDCLVCSDRKNGRRRESGYHCSTCERKPGLHVGNCFEKYHTKEDYREHLTDSV